MKAICFALILRFSEEFNGDMALMEEPREKAWITKIAKEDEYHEYRAWCYGIFDHLVPLLEFGTSASQR